jgi:hypothetical protein
MPVSNARVALRSVLRHAVRYVPPHTFSASVADNPASTPPLALRAVCDIPAGEALFVSYGSGFWDLASRRRHALSALVRLAKEHPHGDLEASLSLRFCVSACKYV